MIPYGRHNINEHDINAVLDALKSDWLTTGPLIERFETAVADYVKSKSAVAMSSGTAALHAAMYALGVQPGDEVIVPPLTFAATANCVVYQGGTPVFADVNPGNLLVDLNKVEAKISAKTKAVIAVDYAGHPCDYDPLREICGRRGLLLVADACHSLGAEYKGKKCGTLADLTVFSFHPVKHITTGEGGMVVTDNPSLAQKMSLFRNHGIDSDHLQRAQKDSWYYEMLDLGYNYRITDIQCALGISQLNRLPDFLNKRRKIARRYHQAFKDSPVIRPLSISNNVEHAYHLYVIAVEFDSIGKSRREVFQILRKAGIGVNVHYIPVHLHPYYRKNYGTGPGDCPISERMYEQILSLPMYPELTECQIDDVIANVFKVTSV